jgi:hypothetical protein
MDNRKLENKADKKPKKRKKKEVVYVATGKYGCLPEGYEKKISNKTTAQRLIDKGYVKIKD